ncbi:MAG: DUF1284 domain-containing protein [Clostridiales Family XIII bacterium]|jgi:hypothetical protein|nr:DUF1284 domain-containing protein [Clostridiales Family XIII bacterium]
MKIHLRPHHLLCTQGYSGKGYSSEYVKNMTAITDILRTDANARVQITFAADDLCRYCPHLEDDTRCNDQHKIDCLDSGVVHLLTLKEGEYAYQDLIHEIHDKINAAKFDEICSTCTWYPISSCKKNILSGRYFVE